MSSQQLEEPFAPFDPQSVLDTNNFALAIAIIVEYLNFGNTREEMARISALSQSWCEAYFGTALFVRHNLTTVLKHHPNLFNPTVLSRARLRPVPREEEDGMDADVFPEYCEPSLLDDDTIYQLVDAVASRQAYGLQLCDMKDQYEHLHPQVLATTLKETELIWNIPGVLANLARLDVDSFGRVEVLSFNDPPDTTVGEPMDTSLAASPRSVDESDMSLDSSDDEEGSESRMSIDQKPEDEASFDSDSSMASFYSVDSCGTFYTARTDLELDHEDFAFDNALGETTSADGGAMEGVEQYTFAHFASFVGCIARLSGRTE
ncbi:hypothetical protein NOR_03262 [Metarhizium rileyi]|uniref:Uncharacterized protein n=1 Tax=Metarhizium rileyi (strain RCEF 4871) TaxID=1649241 RepID=A0A162JQ66_METRR|nr:hypothetical protein NOR_03262 [Metarhizium rileyi RCEF 4871]TWU78343.1 hypothetical protein ED733_008565 [Metarhizium rileyi]